MSPTSDRNHALDGLRGVAAIIVVLSHAALFFYPALHGIGAASNLESAVFSSPIPILYAGNFSVCVFFVLSGYVLSIKYSLTGDDTLVRGMFVKRYFRLMPAVLLVSLINCVLMKLGLMHNQIATSSDWAHSFFNMPPSLIDATHEGMWTNFVSGASLPSYNPPAWTMRVEFFGSLLVFAVCLLAKGNPFRWLVYILVMAAMYATTDRTGVCLSLFLVGMWIAEMPARSLSNSAAFVLVAMSAYLGSYHPGSAFHQPITTAIAWLPIRWPLYVVNAIAATLAFYSVLCNAEIARIFERFSELGRRSYSFYLLHIGIFSSAGLWLFSWLADHFAPRPLAAGASTIFTILLTYLIAGPFTTWVDEPAIRGSGVVLRFLSSKTQTRKTKDVYES